MILRLLSVVFLLVNSSVLTAQVNVVRARPHMLVYKTTADFNDHVPVVLSADKTKIISFPAPTDITAAMHPIALHKGYLLSAYGIGKNTAFLSYTFAQYAALAAAIDPSTLYKSIKNKKPLIQLCDCGVAPQNGSPEKELNALIDQGLLRKKCKAIK